MERLIVFSSCSRDFTFISSTTMSQHASKRSRSRDSINHEPKRCKCGAEDHARTSFHGCILYKSPLRATNKKAVEPSDTNEDEELLDRPLVRTTKIGLGPLLIDRRLQPVIEDAVKRLTQITFEGSRLLNLVVLQILASEDDIPSLDFNSSFVRRCFQAVTYRRGGNPMVPQTVLDDIINRTRDDIYVPCRPVEMPWISIDNLNQLITNTAKTFVTNCQNHVTTNIERRLKAWIKHKLIRVPFLNAKDVGKSVHHITGLLSRDEGFSLPACISTPKYDPYLIQFHACRMEYVWSRAKWEIMGGLDLNPEAIQSNWWNYLPCLYRVLKCFGKPRNLRRKGLRCFSMTPLTSFERRYIYIDTNALHGLYKAAAPKEIPNLELFRNDALNYWNKAFNIHLVTTSNRMFGYGISTDGVGVSVSIDRYPNSKDVVLHNFNSDGTYNSLNLDGCRTVGLDPGRRSLFVAVDNEENVSKCSNKEWRSLAGMRSAQQKREGWLNNRPDIKGIIRRIPIKGTAEVVHFQTYLQYVLLHKDTLLDFYGERKWRKLKWRAYTCKQRAFNEICNRITRGDSNTVVAYGNGGFSSSSRGHASAPVKQLYQQLRRRCRVRLMDEHRSSIVCSKCDEEFAPHQKFWSLRVCKNTCLTLWNRDVNAARNIRHILLYTNSNEGERPYMFKRHYDLEPEDILMNEVDDTVHQISQPQA
jgi:hypothetical protein